MGNSNGWLIRLAALVAVPATFALCFAWRPLDICPISLPASVPPAIQPVRVSPVKVPSQLPDFVTIRHIPTRKTSFFSYLLPLVRQENDRLNRLRQRLEYIRDRLHYEDELPRMDLAWIRDVARDFKLDRQDVDASGFWQDLLLRVDIVPEQLVLIQAANESAWGTSRFAREGNNLFGHWCFRPNCGIVPADRPDGATYEVARFDSVDAAISAYMRNLNTSATYESLRAIRGAHRAAGRDPAAMEMAGGLVRYSERGLDYVADIQTMIRQNEDVINQVQRQMATGEI